MSFPVPVTGLVHTYAMPIHVCAPMWAKICTGNKDICILVAAVMFSVETWSDRL